ncbi:GTP-dependent dephospho-CoA kinase family protein [Archaeoglobus profundus]|uniref:GTP-dependent dephospho-CoA kinase n=1 Tax=Archaeoglobus profundus (strain DSM 5631 / JCM 9629 / NBRC 100127 / Av18) TaxID=572546 RepID=D2RH93_ARCPA|nr:GTP-dependent dephospho-CoA kinase family protein [Archaeoglobus profundus]ADB57668.1 Protein of unknown function DUF359 [Archaeoglobus profundus DSM 5631]
MLKLTEEVRAFAKKPFGLLYRGEGVDVVKRVLKGDEFLVCVGDIVSLTTLKAGFKPKIIVFDGKSIRRELNSVVNRIRDLSRGYKEIVAENPAGCITEDLAEKVFEAVNSALEGLNVRIYVRGEEDLAVMPLVALLPNGAVILYGQPNEGVVRVDVNDERKIIILSMLERMEKHGKTLEKIRRWSNGGSR